MPGQSSLHPKWSTSSCPSEDNNIFCICQHNFRDIGTFLFRNSQLCNTAPTKGSAHRGPRPSLNRVQSGRVGQSISNRAHINKNRGKELLSTTNNQGKELFPLTKNANKELFPELLTESSPQVSSSGPIATKPPPALSPQVRAVQNNVNQHLSSRLTAKRHWKHNRGKGLLAIQAVNLEQRRAKQVRDGTVKRLQALQSNLTYMVDNARDAKTIPYASARLDLKADISISENKKLNFSIAVGFWDYGPAFTPVKVFPLSPARFSDVQGLARLIFGNTDVQEAVAEVGIDIATTALVGYDMAFPKGYRFLQDKGIVPIRDAAIPFNIVPSDRYALVNTDCALKEFFWQAEHYASDEEGNVFVKVVARIAMAQVQPSGEIVFEKFDAKWRNDEEKRWEAEERRQYLEKQSFASGAEKRALKDKMKAIEERTQKAMENAKARKCLATAVLTEQAATEDPNLQVFSQLAGLSVNDDGGADGIDYEMELDLDLDLDLF